MGYIDIDDINRRVNEMAESKDESRGCDGDGNGWNALCDSVAEMIEDINVNEIADHLKEESLFNWCGAWREEAKRRLEEIREYGNRRNQYRG